MTDQELDELEAACSVEVGKDGKVRLLRSDVLEVVTELRELRRCAAALRAHEGAIAHMHRLLTDLRFVSECPPLGENVSGHVAIQDPGR